MKLPADFPCCRAHDLFDQPATYAMAIKRSLADEVYWLNLATEHGDGSTTMQVARLGDEVLSGVQTVHVRQGPPQPRCVVEIGMAPGRGCGGRCGFLDARSAEPESRSDSRWH
jgi:hypothetical protein